jgi:hypothetical protein
MALIQAIRNEYPRKDHPDHLEAREALAGETAGWRPNPVKTNRRPLSEAFRRQVTNITCCSE